MSMFHSDSEREERASIPQCTYLYIMVLYRGVSKVVTTACFTVSRTVPSVSNVAAEGAKTSGSEKKQLPSFWIPSLTPSAKPTEIKKPVSEIYCTVIKQDVALINNHAVKFGQH